jgi:hypothetical protein
MAALRAAGVRIYRSGRSFDGQWTGIEVYLPNQHGDPTDHPLMQALSNAGLQPIYVALLLPPYMRTDLPIILVGEKMFEFTEFPFFPPASEPWEALPLDLSKMPAK